MDPRHEKIAHIALSAAGTYGFALAGGYAVSAHGMIRNETFARLLLAQDSLPDQEPDKLELCADWRAHPPVQLSIGPVLHPDDAVANKMGALFGRAEARDFLDVDAAITSGRFSRERLLELAAATDGGFDRTVFANALASLRGITDADFDMYGVTADELAAMRARFSDWCDDLRTE
ncbi:hypothetical protein [Krasilnikovia sp. MM14-A1004]|uniref:hypothetical protein n=1 Tax=Krasilnikovia sp. MM14-A1004 TaxID=3373541 RepID=UPI00399C4DB4